MKRIINEMKLRLPAISVNEAVSRSVISGFCAELNVQNAAYLGLVPKMLADKYIPVYNSSLLGTVKFACEKTDLAKITEKAEFIDLGADGMFSELFFKNMTFER